MKSLPFFQHVRFFSFFLFFKHLYVYHYLPLCFLLYLMLVSSLSLPLSSLLYLLSTHFFTFFLFTSLPFLPPVSFLGYNFFQPWYFHFYSFSSFSFTVPYILFHIYILFCFTSPHFLGTPDSCPYPPFPFLSFQSLSSPFSSSPFCLLPFPSSPSSPLLFVFLVNFFPTSSFFAPISFFI